MPAVWKPGVKTSRESVCLPQASAHRGVHTKQSIGTCVHFQVCSFIVCQWSRFFLLFCKFCLKDFFYILFSVFTMCREIYPGHRAELFSAIPGFESDGVVRFENQVAIFKGVNIFLTWRWRSFFCAGGTIGFALRYGSWADEIPDQESAAGFKSCAVYRPNMGFYRLENIMSPQVSPQNRLLSRQELL